MAPSFLIAVALTRQPWVLTCPFGWLGDKRLRFVVGYGETAVEDADTQRFLRDTRGRLSRWAGYLVTDPTGKTLYEFDLTVMSGQKVRAVAPSLGLSSQTPSYFADETDEYAYVPVIDGDTFVQIRVFADGSERSRHLRRLAGTLAVLERS